MGSLPDDYCFIIRLIEHSHVLGGDWGVPNFKDIVTFSAAR
jgi:hypothetical protein